MPRLLHSLRESDALEWGEVVAAVQRWVRLAGRAPTTADWRPIRFGGTNRWEEEFPDWPPASVEHILFSGWNGLLEAAGIAVNKPSWNPEEILAAVRRYAEEFGKPPAKNDLEWPPTAFPSARTIRRHFGSFTAGIRAAGLEPKQPRWSEQAIIEAMREFESETDRWPRPSDWTTACEDWPSAGSVYSRFGTWGGLPLTVL